MKLRCGTQTAGWVLAAWLLLAGAAALAQAGRMYPINLIVSPDNHIAYGGLIPDSNTRQETRTEKLVMTLQNTTGLSYSNLTVRYCLFAKDVQTQKIAVALKHETPLVIPTVATLTITSAVASITYKPEHELADTIYRINRRGGSELIREAAVKAAGEEFAGYGIEVRQGDLVIGQSFTSLDRTNEFKAAFSSRKKPAR